jgi:hypothetical protein
VNAALGFGDRHALYPVAAGFELQARVHAAALDAHDDLLVAAVLALAGADDLAAPALRFRIAQIHAQQVAGEQRRLVATGAGADLEVDVATVVRVGRQQQALQLGLGGFEALLERRQLGLRQLAQLGVVASGERARVGERGLEVQILPVGRGGGGELGVLAGQRGVALTVLGQPRVGQ